MAANIETLVEQIGSLTLVEASDLKKALEEKFGVTAAAPMMMAGGAAPAAAAAVEEKTEFNLILADAGSAKINVIKAVLEITGLGLKNAEDLVDGAPKPVKEGDNKEEAETIKKKIEE